MTKMKHKLTNPEKASQGLRHLIRFTNVMKCESLYYHLALSSWLYHRSKGTSRVLACSVPYSASVSDPSPFDDHLYFFFFAFEMSY